MEKKRYGLLPFNIQLFAEKGEGDNGQEGNNGSGEPKTYSQEEYEKLKSAFDKASSELSKTKKSLNEKLSEEEKQLEVEKQREVEHENLVKELKTLKISGALAKGGYEEKEVEELTKIIVEGDADKICNSLANLRKKLVEDITKKAQEEFSRQSKLPGGTNGDDDTDSFVQEYLEQKKKSSNRAKEYYKVQ